MYYQSLGSTVFFVRHNSANCVIIPKLLSCARLLRGTTWRPRTRGLSISEFVSLKTLHVCFCEGMQAVAVKIPPF